MNGRTDSHRHLFERLCFYRALYARRGPRDRTGVVTITEAIRWASAALAAPTSSLAPAA